MTDVRQRSSQHFRQIYASVIFLLLPEFGLAGAFAQVATRPAAAITPSALQRALEDEQAKTRQLQIELDRTKAQLATERGRSEDLQRKVDQLEKLLGGSRGTRGTSDHSTRRNDPTVVFVDFPARKTDAVGQVQSTETKLVDPLLNADRLRVSPLESEDEPQIISLEADSTGTTVNIVCLAPEQGKVTVASLVLKTTGLFWLWNSFRAEAGMAGVLERLEDTLCRSKIELLGDHDVAARVQFSPIELEIKVPTAAGWSPPVRLPKKVVDVRLESDTSSTGCKAKTTGDNKLCFAVEDQQVELTLNTKMNMLTIERQISDPPEIRQLNERIQVLQRELDRLRRVRSAKEATKSSGDDRKKESSDRSQDSQISDINRRISSCTKERDRLHAAQSRRKAIDFSGCSANLTLPNGVILCRLKLKTS